ncbi:hypothetical protein B0T24DRAFT_674148 [Lasiosphaeria ovina]|uniref:Uncharacterized protein n=1 Tax=Lasiosphaeria ovina TaxID=92902 RepID=A0AAE0TYK5_9PEZI|nr:hypothetical protein B0T24DRAFT_674148 [Lasiosphaeria ovina]
MRPPARPALQPRTRHDLARTVTVTVTLTVAITTTVSLAQHIASTLVLARRFNASTSIFESEHTVRPFGRDKNPTE